MPMQQSLAWKSVLGLGRRLALLMGYLSTAFTRAGARG
jgi:hypothetical protein